MTLFQLITKMKGILCHVEQLLFQLLLQQGAAIPRTLLRVESALMMVDQKLEQSDARKTLDQQGKEQDTLALNVVNSMQLHRIFLDINKLTVPLILEMLVVATFVGKLMSVCPRWQCMF